MRVVVAPDSFGGTMSAVAAARAIAAGWSRARPDDEVHTLPLADGGEGTTDAVLAAHPTAGVQHVEVADARGLATTARWLQLQDGTCVIETAEAVGLAALEQEHRDPLRTTSYGVGQLLLAATAAVGEASRVVVGLGGSATVDGGAGMLSALTGHGLRRADGNGVRVGGRWAAQTVDARRAAAALADLRRTLADRGVTLTIAADVDSPLLGEAGAARTFGPQKGASAADVEELERGLQRYADVIERDLCGGLPHRQIPGAGAAGGLGFALACAFDVTPQTGAAVIAGIIDVDGLLGTAGADVVVTGEGRLDAQTAAGKVAEHVRRRAGEIGARCVAVVGSVADGAGAAFEAVSALGEDGLQRPESAAADAAAALARGMAG